jgi:hypothetical protein
VLRLPATMGNDTCPAPVLIATIMGQASTICAGQGTTGMEVDFLGGGIWYQIQMAAPRSAAPISSSVVQMITSSLKIGSKSEVGTS